MYEFEMDQRTKYKDKYRIASARRPNWNYSGNAHYFVTICLDNMKKHHFGEIVNRQMRHSEIGEIANTCWKKIPNHFPFVILHNHVIMPNHVHGIVQIAKMNGNSYLGSFTKETQNIASLRPRTDHPHTPRANHSHAPRTDHPHTTPANHALRTLDLPNKNKFGPQSQNLGAIIRGFKIGVTKYARNTNPDFKWQARFHDRIIRNERQFNNVQNYISNNPKNWKKDKFNIKTEPQ